MDRVSAPELACCLLNTFMQTRASSILYIVKDIKVMIGKTTKGSRSWRECDTAQQLNIVSKEV